MLTLRQRIFVIVSVVVGLILAFLLLYYFVFKTGSQPQTFIKKLFKITTSTEQVITPGGTNVVSTTPKVFAKYSPEVYVKQVARMFVERFGSFSNQNNNQHIADVLSLVTPTMEKWLNTQILSESNNYLGETTKVIASHLDSITPAKAVVLFDAQQTQETKAEVKTLQRSGRVELLKVGEDWKVDGFYWNK